jgi:hypothetical protein
MKDSRNRRFKAHAPVCSLVAMVLFAASASAQSDGSAPPLGGPGGSPFVARCPQHQYLTGFEIRGGALVDAIRPICVVAYSATEPGPLQPYPAMFGGPGGSSRQLLCPPGLPIVKGMQIGWKLRNPAVIHSIGLSCGNAATGHEDAQFSPVPLEFISSDYSPYVNPDNPSEASSIADCDGPQDDFRGAAVGVTGRSGEWLDALGVICEPLVVITPKPVALGRQATSGTPAQPLQTIGDESPICARARDARTRNSPLASRLEAQCRAAGGNFVDRAVTQSATGADRAAAVGSQAAAAMQTPEGNYKGMHLRSGALRNGVASRIAIPAASSPETRPSTDPDHGFAPPLFADGAQLWACNDAADGAACTGLEAGAAFCRLQGLSGTLQPRADGTPDLTLQARRPGAPVRSVNGTTCGTEECIAVVALHCAP